MRRARRVTAKGRGVPLARALDAILRSVALKHYVTDHGLLVVTTQQGLCGALFTHVYPVGDLVQHLAGRGEAPDRQHDAYVELLGLVESLVAPDSWDSVGGPGSVQAYEPACALVITQTPELHERIVELFATFRSDPGRMRR